MAVDWPLYRITAWKSKFCDNATLATSASNADFASRAYNANSLITYGGKSFQFQNSDDDNYYQLVGTATLPTHTLTQSGTQWRSPSYIMPDGMPSPPSGWGFFYQPVEYGGGWPCVMPYPGDTRFLRYYNTQNSTVTKVFWMMIPV